MIEYASVRFRLGLDGTLGVLAADEIGIAPLTVRRPVAALACPRRGLTLPTAAHAYALLDAFVHGFAPQEAALPFDGGEEAAELAAAVLASLPDDTLPHLAEMARDHVVQPGYDFGAEFDFGRERVLDGLAAAAERATPASRPRRTGGRERTSGRRARRP